MFFVISWRIFWSNARASGGKLPLCKFSDNGKPHFFCVKPSFTFLHASVKRRSMFWKLGSILLSDCIFRGDILLTVSESCMETLAASLSGRTDLLYTDPTEWVEASFDTKFLLT